jgi:hypothetical protein
LVLDRVEYRAIFGEEDSHDFRDAIFKTSKRRARDGGGELDRSQCCFSGMVVDSSNGCAQSGRVLEARFADFFTRLVFQSAVFVRT